MQSPRTNVKRMLQKYKKQTMEYYHIAQDYDRRYQDGRGLYLHSIDMLVHHIREGKDKQAYIDDFKKTLEDEKQALDYHYKNEIRNFDKAARLEIQKLTDNHTAEINLLNVQRDRLVDDYENKLSDLKKEHNNDLITQAGKIEFNLGSLKSEHAEEIARLNNSHAKVLKDYDDKARALSKTFKELVKEKEAEIESIKLKYESEKSTDIKVLEQRYQSEVARISASKEFYEQQLEKTIRENNAFVDELLESQKQSMSIVKKTVQKLIYQNASQALLYRAKVRTMSTLIYVLTVYSLTQILAMGILP